MMKKWWICFVCITVVVPMAFAQTREERLAAGLRRFPQADTNKDGVLTVEEAKTFQNKQRQRKRQTKELPPPTHADVVYESHYDFIIQKLKSLPRSHFKTDFEARLSEKVVVKAGGKKGSEACRGTSRPFFADNADPRALQPIVAERSLEMASKNMAFWVMVKLYTRKVGLCNAQLSVFNIISMNNMIA